MLCPILPKVMDPELKVMIIFSYSASPFHTQGILSFSQLHGKWSKMLHIHSLCTLVTTINNDQGGLFLRPSLRLAGQEEE